MNLAKFLSKRTPFFYGWLILGTSGSTQIVRNAAASLTLAVFMYPMAEDLGWSRTVLAGAVSVGGLASTFISPAIGWLIDRYGARTVLTSSIMILGVSTFLTGWATVPIAFYITYGIGRIIFSSPVQIGSSVVVSRWFIKKRGRANGILTFCHSIGMTGFPLMASILIGIYGWQVAWHLLGVGVWVIALLPVFLFLAETPESVGLLPDGENESLLENETVKPAAEKEEVNWTLREALKTVALWQLAIAGGLLFIIHSGTNTHMAAFFQDAGLTSNQAAAAVSLNAIFTGLGGLGWGWAIEKIKARYCYAMVAAVMSVCAILFSTADSVTEAWIYASLFGTALGGMLVVPSVAMADYFGRGSLGTIRGFTEPFVSFSQAIGALLSGIIFDLTGSYNYAFYTLAVVAIIAILLTITATVPIHRDNKKG
ncbi:MAG: MFS transporter [SAR202 cluster bacterium]|nr:MAG: MFS transporter [SAR202 cluster bacterium]MED5409091.1 MFS transporter [Chloroflexota bacterium]